MKKLFMLASVIAVAASCAKVEGPVVAEPNYTLLANVPTTKTSISDKDGKMM